MSGTKEIANSGKYAVQTQRVEGFLKLTAANTPTALTTNAGVYFQKLWIYPGATATGNKINANVGNVYVGNTAVQLASVTLSDLAIIASGVSTENASLLVTAVATAHGFNTGDYVTIAGASDAAFNGVQRITKLDANTFTYMLADPPLDTTPGGTITASGLQAIPATSATLPDTLQPTDLPLKYELPLGQKQLLSSILVMGAINDGVFYRAW